MVGESEAHLTPPGRVPQSIFTGNAAGKSWFFAQFILAPNWPFVLVNLINPSVQHAGVDLFLHLKFFAPLGALLVIMGNYTKCSTAAFWDFHPSLRHRATPVSPNHYNMINANQGSSEHTLGTLGLWVRDTTQWNLSENTHFTLMPHLSCSSNQESQYEKWYQSFCTWVAASVFFLSSNLRPC